MNKQWGNSLFVAAMLLLPAQAGKAAEAGPDVYELKLEELMEMVVTSVSKKEQTLAETAAAAYVIQAEDIRRSGATNIPEALRLAPGVQVSSIGKNKWAISIRGQADQYANKLLVLVDGRSAYSPLFSGVQWEALDIPLETIERIEVIRGPGASIWGANAVNGVINIITRSAFDVLGGQAAVAAGSELHAYGFARYGWSPNPDTAIQLHAKAHDYGASKPVSGGEGYDDWQSQTLGFKLEHLLQSGPLKVQGRVFKTHAGDEVTVVSEPPANTLVQSTEKMSGGDLMASWDMLDGHDRKHSVRAYVEHTDYDHVILKELRTTFDLEYQQQIGLGAHDLIWGLGYRHSRDQIDSSAMVMVNETERATHLYSAYVQDEITLQPERWRLSLGARLEHNPYTGFEFQPNARLLWTPDPRNSVWASVARAVRTPSRIERGGAAYVHADPLGVEPPFSPFPSITKLVSEDTDSEQLDALDVGWRYQINPTTSLDLAAFIYHYDQLRGAQATVPTYIPTSLTTGYLLIQTQNNNANSANSHGLEASLDWRPRANWRLQANYSWLDMNINTAGLLWQVESDYTGSSPTHQFSLRSSLDLTPTLRWDAWLRYVSPIDRYAVPEFTTLDMRIAWQPSKTFELSLVGQNLLDSAHREYETNFFKSTPTEVQRGVYLKADWIF